MDRNDERRERPDTVSAHASRSAREGNIGAVVSDRNIGDPTLEKRLESLNVRLGLKGLPPVAAAQPGIAITAPPGDRARHRLSAFSGTQIEEIRKRVGPILQGPWPEIDGCLGVLFTSRTGSTYLARELALRYRIGRMEECLNPQMVSGIAPADIVRSYANSWFSFKLGVPGIICGELGGVISEYIEKTFLIFLLRRDIVGQAVSLVKANQTGQWHSIQAPRRPAQYDGTQIAHSVRVIADAVASLREYIRRAERPWRTLFYEDFEHGDFRAAEAICDEFAVPRLRPRQGRKPVRLVRTADEVNRAWVERFHGEMDGGIREVMARYAAQF